MMNKLTQALKVKNDDNGFTAFAKGGAEGIIQTAIASGAVVGVAAIIGMVVKKKNNSTEGEA